MANLLYIQADYNRSSGVVQELLRFYAASDLEHTPGLESAVTIVNNQQRDSALQGTPLNFAATVRNLTLYPENRRSISLIVRFESEKAANEFYQGDIYRQFLALVGDTSALGHADYAIVRINDSGRGEVSRI